MGDAAGADEMIRRLQRVVAALGRLDLSLVDQAERHRAEALGRSISGHVIPRLREPDAPLTIAVVGPSGSGKTTLINSLARRTVGPTGLLRPTTTVPVAWVGEMVPPALLALPEPPTIAPSTGRPPPHGIALVDTPPPGMGSDAALRVLEVADACIAVLSATRYADVAGWDLLAAAARRRLPMVFVMNRLPESATAQAELRDDLARRLAGRALLPRPEAAMVVGIAEGPIDRSSGRLPEEWVNRLAKEIDALAEPADRRVVADRVLKAGLDRAGIELGAVHAALVRERNIRSRLLAPVASAFAAEARLLTGQLESGELATLGDATEPRVSDLAAVVTRRAGRAARAAARVWEQDVVGDRIVSADGHLFGHGEGTMDDARSRVAEWHHDLLDRVAPGVRGILFRCRRRRDFAEDVAAGVLAPGRALERRMARRMRRVDETISGARARLIDDLCGVLQRDAERFSAALGPEVDHEVDRVLAERVGAQ